MDVTIEKTVYPGQREALVPVEDCFLVSETANALARDLAALRGHYDIASVRAYDFFPHTPHIETLAVLHRR
jgi:tRNA/tmRNA/rRNA uracil-C5-methylase (TrmA/RlmC/RlmD family)